MKIEDVIGEMEQSLYRGAKGGELMSWILALKEASREVSHLIETWRHISSLRDSPLPDQACYIIGECADQLQSIFSKE